MILINKADVNIILLIHSTEGLLRYFSFATISSIIQIQSIHWGPRDNAFRPFLFFPFSHEKATGFYVPKKKKVTKLPFFFLLLFPNTWLVFIKQKSLKTCVTFKNEHFLEDQVVCPNGYTNENRIDHMRNGAQILIDKKMLGCSSHYF